MFRIYRIRCEVRYGSPHLQRLAADRRYADGCHTANKWNRSPPADAKTLPGLSFSNLEGCDYAG
jgi:hypothetical protein